MKKYIALVLVSIIGLASLAYAYFYSRDNFNINHHDIVNLLSDTKQSETETNKDILRVHNFLLQDYDSIAAQKEKLESFCSQDNGPLFKLYPKQSENFKSNYYKYCEALNLKILAIEDFKSLNSVYRNSLLFLHAQALAWEDTSSKSKSKQQRDTEYLANLVLNYTLVSDTNTRAKIDKFSDYFKQKYAKPDIIADHAFKLTKIKSQREQAAKEIINSSTHDLFEKLSQAYFDQYQDEQNNLLSLQQLLLVSCVVLLMFVIFNVLKIWQTARALHKANLTLEERVSDRTKELMASQQTIIEQQETLVLTSKMSALGEMAGGVAHEINTPLAIIQLRTEQIQEAIHDPQIDLEFTLKALGAIDTTVKRIAKIINGLRSFARDGRKDPISLYSVSQIVDETFSLCRERFNSHGVPLEYICESDIHINCRSVEISQVLLNLLNNSYDAIQTLPEKWVKVKLQDQNENIILSVIDSGTGIPPEVQQKMMQPFFTTKEIGKGTGLGLSISRGIIESHGGRLQIVTNSTNTEIAIILPKNYTSD